MPHKKKHTYENFPVFSGWPSNKVFFLENMAWEQHFQQQRQHEQLHEQLQHQLQGQLQGQLQAQNHRQLQQQQQLHQQQEVHDDISLDTTTDDKEYVVITKDMEERMVYDCVICTQKLCLVFNQDEEEWVFDNCRQYEGVVYHFPLCYEVGVEVKRKGSC